MASTAVDDKSAAVADESDAAAATTATASSCLNDPNYAIICVFLEKFGAHLKIEHPDFLQLQKMIENTDEGRSAVYAFLTLFRYTHTHHCVRFSCVRDDDNDTAYECRARHTHTHATNCVSAFRVCCR